MPEQNNFASHIVFHVETGHAHNSGVVACPVAGPDPQNASLVRLHAPIEVVSVHWTSSRDGAPPVCPHYNDFIGQLTLPTGYTQNVVFLGGKRSGVATPVLGGHNWSMSGVYDYIIRQAKGLDSDMPVAKCPWVTAPVGEFYVPAANFLPTGIINNQTELDLPMAISSP